ncbi:MAG: hypothetical protein AMJ79_00880 [Phycisphaerae bacterium SM23_30]|nr:MAG: hypothetical protein AMJ79_00880 [Phycisphaerae bacterium SM23_30]
MKTIISLFFGENQYTLWQIIRDYGIIFPVVFIVTLGATWICQFLALKWGIMDLPDGDVKPHEKPTAYLGGVGIWFGLLVGLTIGLIILRRLSIEITNNKISNVLMLKGIYLGATIACIVGLLDDIFNIKPWQKFLGQTIAASALILVGIRPDLKTMFSLLNIPLPDVLLTILSVPIVVFFVLGATNSLNLLDGLDGLCAGVTAIISAGFFVLSVSLTTCFHDPMVDPIRLILCLSLTGGSLGFLILNRHPARIYMGDAGSMLLGYMAATLIILFIDKLGNWSTAAIIIFGLPILDTSVTLVRRFINKQPIFAPDRSHIYDQLISKGHSLRKTVNICYALSGFFVMIGLPMRLFSFEYSILFFSILVLISGFFIWWFDFLRMPKIRN